MKTVELLPFASVLLESMRAIGYDPAAAVADLVDNCISAKAGNVDILFSPGAPRHFAILDDGDGMDATELQNAMRHGSRSPMDQREATDLGRFGLGMKTASLSQCRRLTVVSLKNRTLSGMVWDLDLVADRRGWVADVLEAEDLDTVPWIEALRSRRSGTLVVWTKLDRLADGDPGDGSILGDKVDTIRSHLSLVFHRYLSARSPTLSIAINDRPIEPLHPFLEEEGAEAGPEESLVVAGHRIALRAYTLPHISRLTRAQIAAAGGEEGLRRRQGFYIYRERRLIIWGTWFRLSPKQELTKLTRVRVDVPNTLDHLWSLDIKKSFASPPAIIRDRLRSLVPTMVGPSERTHHWRGRVTGTRGIQTMWRRTEDRDGVRYDLDPEHPLVAGFRESLDDALLGEFGNLVRALADSLPVEALYNDRACDRIGHRSDPPDDVANHLEELARQMLAAFADRPAERQRLLDGLSQIEPFALHPKLLPHIKQRLA